MNLNLLNSFEKEFAYPLSRISEEKFLEIFTSKKLYNKYFNFKKISDIEDIITFLKENPNLCVFSETATLKINLYKNKKYIDDIFSRYVEDKNRLSLLDAIKEMITSEDSLKCLIAVLCSLISLEDQDISVYFPKVSSAFDKLFEEIKNLIINNVTYSAHCDIIDLLIAIRFYWNRRFSDKLLVLNDLEKYLNQLHEFEFEYFDKGKFTSLEIAPEKLQLLDITKLKRKE